MNGTHLSMYVNASIQSDIKAQTTVFNSNSKLEIGTFNQGGAFEWDGKIDEVMIFNTGLTGEQIAAIYENQSNKFKQPATLEVASTNSIIAGNNTINLSLLSYEITNGSSISARMGEWNATGDQTVDYLDNDAEDSLILSLHFDNSFNDSNTLLFNGTVFGDVDLGNLGKYNGSVNFNGSGNNDYISYPDLNNTVYLGRDDADYDYSVCFWYQFNTTADIVAWSDARYKPGDGKVDGIYMRTYNGLQGRGWEFAICEDNFDTACDNYYSGDVGYSDGAWRHICITADWESSIGQTDVIMYHNGIEDGVSEFPMNQINLPNDAKTFTIGFDFTGGDFAGWEGKMDEFRIWNRTLSYAEVTEEYVKTLDSIQWKYGDYQTISEGRVQAEFNVSNTSTNFLPSFRLNNEYSPLMVNNVTLEYFFTEAAASVPSINSITFDPANNSEHNPSYSLINVTVNITDTVTLSNTTLQFNLTNYTLTPLTDDLFYNDTIPYQGAGDYPVIVYVNNTDGGEKTLEVTYTIQKNTTVCELNFTTPLGYPQSVLVNGSCSHSESITTLYVDGAATTNPFNQVLGVGVYNFTLNVSETQNYTFADESVLVNVTKGISTVYMYVDV
jgi:hypothetical protein